MRGHGCKLLQLHVAGLERLRVLLKLAFVLLAGADVAHRGCGKQAVVGFQRRQADLNREFRTVPAAPAEFQTRPHLAHLGPAEVMVTVRRVGLAQTLGDEYLDGAADHGFPLVAEQPHRLGIDQRDLALAVDDYHGVGRGFQQITELPLCLAPRRGVANRSRREQAARCVQRTQADLDRKFRSILATAAEVQVGPHLPHLGLSEIGVAGNGMPLTELVGDQLLHRLAK